MKKILYVIIPVIFFTLNIIIGFMDYNNVLKLAESIFGEFKEVVAEKVLSTKIKVMLIIFTRNLSVASIMIVTGPFLALLAIIITSFNGYVIGGIAHYSIINRGVTKTLALIVPHGVIEVPTILYAAYLSIYIAVEYYRNRDKFYLIYLQGLRNIIFKIAPLLLIAAFIETFITPYIAGLL